MTSVAAGHNAVEKSGRVQYIFDALATDLAENRLTPQDHANLLGELKVFSREPLGSDQMYTLTGITTLASYAFGNEDIEVSREALRCLANTLYLHPPARQIFVDIEGPEKACEQFNANSVDDEFLLARTLFICTYGTNIDLVKLLDFHNLGGIICEAIHRHGRYFLDDGLKDTCTDMDELALQETLKLLFNITHFVPQNINLFSKCIPDLFPNSSKS